MHALLRYMCVPILVCTADNALHGSFLPPLPGFALFLSFVVRRLGVSYFTKLWSGGPGMALRPLVSSLQRRNGGLEKVPIAPPPDAGVCVAC